ncbi:hypothetical protein LJC26_02045 [Desulfovibrio sp. OttesenSCG-928-O18]|nr:hypothetical protein [Desulfovibrio sp. OttesenSCG-928-O18]
MNKRKIYLIVGGLCVLVAAGLFIAKNQYEAKMRGDIETFLANLPAPLTAVAEKIEVSVLDRSFALTNLKGQYKSESTELEFSTARVEAKGVNLDAFKADAGSVLLADSVKLTNNVVKTPGVYAGIESYALENVSGNITQLADEYIKVFPDLVALLKAPGFEMDKKAQRQALGALSGLLKAYETFSAGKVTMTNYVHTSLVDDKKMTMTLARSETQKYSIRETGPSSMTGLSFTIDEKPFMAWESLRYDGITLPSFVEFLNALCGEVVPPREKLKATLEGQVFALNNLRGKSFVAHDPEDSERKLFALADFGLSYEARDAHTVNFTYSGFDIDKKLIEDDGDLSDEALALLPTTLSFEGAFQGTLTRKDENTASADFKRIHLKEASLGEMTLAFSIKDVNVLAIFLGMPGPAALESLDLNLVDNGMSELLFTVAAEEAEDSAANVRTEVVNQFTTSREALPNDTLKGLADASAKFLEKSGKSFRLTLAPAKPLPLMLIQSAAFTDPDKLGLTYSVTPDK